MASVIDSRIFRNLFGTDEIRNVFLDETYVANMIAVKGALARAESSTGVIPSDVGLRLSETLLKISIDYERLAAETEIVGYPVLPLVRQLVESTPDDIAKYIHWGATTQDIMDDAAVLQMKSGLAIVERNLVELQRILARLARTHRDTTMAGRTHLQHALPATFGYKCAVYLSSVTRHMERLGELKSRCLLVQFGGAAGTLASLGSDGSGSKVRAQLAVELGLRDPEITWHVARDNIAECLNFLALVGGSLGKIAYDIMIMSSNEFGEVSEPFVPHRGASSTMPQKRNPISSEVVLAASKLLRANAGLGLDAMVSDFERASGPWHLEWAALPEAFIYAVGALHQICFALDGLVVNVDVMTRNLYSTRGLIVGEAVMMGLAPHLGRQRAHDIVYEACKQSIEMHKDLLSVLSSMEEITSVLGKQELSLLCDPEQYLGDSKNMVDSVLESIARSSKQIKNNGNMSNHTNGITNGVYTNGSRGIDVHV